MRALTLACSVTALLSHCARAQPSPEAKPTATKPMDAAAPPATVAEPAAEPAAQPAVPQQPQSPRVYAKTRFVWIRPEPDASKQWIGYLWSGESAKLVTGRPVYGPGCMTWYAVEPVGFVCVDGLRATLDASDPGVVAIEKYAADLSSAWPHQYGETGKLKRLLGVPGSPLSFPNLPISIHDSRTEFRRGSTVAFVSEIRAGGQDYLLGADLSYFSKQLVTPYPRYDYHGVDLSHGLRFPLALFRASDRPKFKRTGSEFSETGGKFARLSSVALTGHVEPTASERFYETVDGDWVKAEDAVLPAPSSRPPWGSATPEGRATWIEVSVTGGWLIAYENTTPVFVTLISAGRGGPAKPGEDPTTRARTPLGVFPISGKFATATMEAPGNLIHSAVPWTQNFSGPHALHAAYWHDDWGNPKSGGCINVSPRDGKKLFEWTEPRLPEGWHGVRWMPWRGPATLMVIRR